MIVMIGLPPPTDPKSHILPFYKPKTNFQTHLTFFLNVSTCKPTHSELCTKTDYSTTARMHSTPLMRRNPVE
ncbi:hypothetical protein Hanom_Chr04g00376061 [Helianthus anomalus]